MVSVQIRDVPEQVRDTLSEVARSRGQSMQAYLHDVLEQEAQRANNTALLEGLRAMGGGYEGAPGETAGELDAIRSERNGRETETR